MRILLASEKEKTGGKKPYFALIRRGGVWGKERKNYLSFSRSSSSSSLPGLLGELVARADLLMPRVEAAVQHRDLD